MSRFLKIFAICLFIVACGENNEKSDLTITTENSEIKYIVEMAVSPKQLSKGLMNRQELAANSGMIFDVREFGEVAFWMKETYIPLDMLFLDDNGLIVWIYQGAEPLSETLIQSPVATSFVLELNAGDVEKHNILLGDKVKHQFLNM